MQFWKMLKIGQNQSSELLIDTGNHRLDISPAEETSDSAFILPWQKVVRSRLGDSIHRLRVGNYREPASDLCRTHR